MRNLGISLLTGILVLSFAVGAKAQSSDALWITDPSGAIFAWVSQDETTETGSQIISLAGSGAWLDPALLSIASWLNEHGGIAELGDRKSVV